MEVGDRVRVIANEEEPSIGIYYNIGDKGTIIEIGDCNIMNCEVKFDEGSLRTDMTWWAMEKSLELIKESETK